MFFFKIKMLICHPLQKKLKNWDASGNWHHKDFLTGVRSLRRLPWLPSRPMKPTQRTQGAMPHIPWICFRWFDLFSTINTPSLFGMIYFLFFSRCLESKSKKFAKRFCHTWSSSSFVKMLISSQTHRLRKLNPDWFRWNSHIFDLPRS